jgi:hypothetical protein
VDSRSRTDNVSEHAQPEADQSTESAHVQVESSLTEFVLIHAHLASPASEEPARDVSHLVPHALVTQSASVPTASIPSSSTPTQESANRLPPVTSVKKKSTDNARESAMPTTSSKMELVSSEVAQPTSRITDSEDVSFLLPTPTDVKSPHSDSTESAFQIVATSSSLTHHPEHAEPAQVTVKHASLKDSVSLVLPVSLQLTEDVFLNLNAPLPNSATTETVSTDAQVEPTLRTEFVSEAAQLDLSIMTVSATTLAPWLLPFQPRMFV